ncbi:glucose-6-phosphate dehydrogenase assembly protein OpcA [Catellatospora sp. IY07-71]|uniref:glucose-6-phosphate dehydrogenase assembly protein OpcA n=1 Tax=Catellatospora sp. IY07-71 TaxID=2728827 RepID=UPI001BB357DE|nr:glucose-6-phosphate dehydrogenase assembly protein OpcA [Catellatospora sp. IY07-71]BCJ77669.1 glucose-6-phosphate dehydrogenase assembly protein OpcA [Catellatospora sp. IY07-71]
MLALWDTTGNEVVRKLASERRNAGGVASGLALNLVVIVDEGRVRQVEDAATIAAASHPCRLLVVSRGPVAGVDTATAVAKDRLDAEIVVGGRLGPCEAVIMRMHGRLALHSESVVMPLLAPDVPVVTWWHGCPPEHIAYDPLGVVAERRVTDIAQCPDPAAALRQRAVDYAPGDTDLSWTRLTGWRSLIAGAFDTEPAPAVSARVHASPGDPLGALLRGWIIARTQITVETADAAHGSLSGVDFTLADGGSLSLHSTGDGMALLRKSGVRDQVLPLVERRLGEVLAEELQRLDADQPYAAALAAATGSAELAERAGVRTHIWQDPAWETVPA